MLLPKKGLKIDEFILDDEDAYIITYKNSDFWSVDVSRKTGLVGLIKSNVLPENVDNFEARRNGHNTEIYLHTTDKFGSHEDYIGEIDDHAAAKNWVSAVNKIYESRRNNQESTGD